MVDAKYLKFISRSLSKSEFTADAISLLAFPDALIFVSSANIIAHVFSSATKYIFFVYRSSGPYGRSALQHFFVGICRGCSWHPKPPATYASTLNLMVDGGVVSTRSAGKTVLADRADYLA